jgi:hypothetical protein
VCLHIFFMHCVPTRHVMCFLDITQRRFDSYTYGNGLTGSIPSLTANLALYRL